MGTARAEKESEEHRNALRRNIELLQRRRDLERRIEEARSRMEFLSAELELETRRRDDLARSDAEHLRAVRHRREPPGTDHIEGGDE